VRRRKRRKEIAELLETLLEKHPDEVIYVAWDNANTHQDDEVEAVVRGAAGRLILLYLPTYSPWLNPIEPKWVHGKRAVAEPTRLLSMSELMDRVCAYYHCELTEPIAQLDC